MMKRILAMLAAITLLALSALAEEGDDAAALQGEVYAAYAAVLLDGAPAIRMADEFHGVEGASEEDVVLTDMPVRFTLLDMDTYGVQELVLEMEEPERYIVLTWYDGRVYVAELPYLALLDLKDDGTHTFSSGAFDSGVAMLLMESTTVTTGVLAEMRSGGDAVTYIVSGEETDETTYEAFLTAQDEKLPALWYDYSAEMVAVLLGQ